VARAASCGKTGGSIAAIRGELLRVETRTVALAPKESFLALLMAAAEDLLCRRIGFAAIAEPVGYGSACSRISIS